MSTTTRHGCRGGSCRLGASRQPTRNILRSRMDSLLHYLIPIMLVAGTVAFMEWFAAWSHEHIMHGWGWGWHKSHHEPHDQALEKNDLYAVVFAAFAIALFWFGGSWFWPLPWIAIGITIYGVLYFFMHDGLVH